jgi:hypothetical protein
LNHEERFMALPNFLVIGVGKSGTTSLYHYLGQHPQIGMSKIKEPRYLIHAGCELAPTIPCTTVFRVTSLAEYQQQYAPVADRKARGDISPTYIMHPEQAILGIRHVVPDAKLIAIFRHPADRGYSNYLMHVRMGDEVLPTYAEALAAERAGLRRADGQARNYFDRGFYAARLQQFVDAFPQNPFHFLLYDDLVRDPNSLLRQLFRFLEVDEEFQPDMEVRHNAGSWPQHFLSHRIITSSNPIKRRIVRTIPTRLRRTVVEWFQEKNLQKPPKLDPALRRELTGMYREDILRLQDILHRDLSAWWAEKK